MLSALIVTTAADNGSNSAPTAGSLRAAILQADALPAGTLTTIDFTIGTGPQTIRGTIATGGAALSNQGNGVLYDTFSIK